MLSAAYVAIGLFQVDCRPICTS